MIPVRLPAERTIVDVQIATRGDGRRDVAGMQRTEDAFPTAGGSHGDIGRLQVANFADKYHIWIHPQ